MKEAALFAAGIIFLVVGLMHVTRLFFKIEVKIAEVPVPLWTSFYGFIVAFAFSYWMFAAAR